MAVNLWSKEELILAFNLYLKLPFGKMHSRTPEVIHLGGFDWTNSQFNCLSTY
jgi:putative restriction endonuclease